MLQTETALLDSYEASLSPKPSPQARLALEGVTKILFGGLDGAGKSTLACSTYIALKEQGIDVSLHELDPWSDTHAPLLGAKDWNERRKRSKVWRTTYERYVDGFAEDQSAVVLGDMQGRYQYTHNHLLTGLADHAILVSRNATEKDAQIRHPQDETAWEELFNRLAVPISLRVHSLLPGQEAPIGRLGIEGLDRKLVPEHPKVQKVAAKIISLSMKN